VGESLVKLADSIDVPLRTGVWELERSGAVFIVVPVMAWCRWGELLGLALISLLCREWSDE
jgi:hypothetical protein